MSPVGLLKLLDWPKLLEARTRWRREGLRVVWTNGCFDLFHVGHLRSLQTAKRLGDILVVGVNSDTSISRIKGATRPIMEESHRTELLCGLSCVDHVVLFDEDTPEAALRRIQPEVHCKGDDYAPPHGKPVPEARLVESLGGKVEYLPLLPGLSTSALVRKIREMAE